MVAQFELPWVGDLDESFQEWLNRYAWPSWMLVPWNPHTFENEYHTIACDKYKVIYNVEIAEGKDRPIVMGKKEF